MGIICHMMLLLLVPFMHLFTLFLFSHRLHTKVLALYVTFANCINFYRKKKKKIQSSIIFGPSIPRRAASPVKLRKIWQNFPDVLRHWSTFWYWYHRRESLIHFVVRGAMRCGKRPIIQSLERSPEPRVE